MRKYLNQTTAVCIREERSILSLPFDQKFIINDLTFKFPRGVIPRLCINHCVEKLLAYKKKTGDIWRCVIYIKGNHLNQLRFAAMI
jgi:hypothetical protein